MPGDVGEVRPFTYGPVGQVFLSTLKSEEVEALLSKYPLEQHTPYSVLSRRSYMARLPQVLSEGYAVEVNEVVEGLMGIAAPIFDFTGNAVAVLSLGSEISANLGYAGASKGSDDPEVTSGVEG
jgi:DNA-binding IclR family transcriptional regulator